MMILTPEKAIKKAKQLQALGKKIVLTGGCFDIFHLGHLMLLQNAKEQGDILFVLLESDKKITELKGSERPLHTQTERGIMLTAIRFVDYVIMLPYFSEDAQYDNLVTSIAPDIIATTEHD